MSDAIVVVDLGKRYRVKDPNRVWTLQEALITAQRRRRTDYFWSLRHVSLTVARSRMLGVLGSNGAGKTTLLRLIAGIGQPDEGNIRVVGAVRGLLDLGAGFHWDLTGRENVFISGIVQGLTRREVKRQFDSIVSFAELEHAIERPFRTYSSGMQMRLGFAVAIHTAPDVLLVDELLAVGDVAFRHKCLAAIRELRNREMAAVVVSHDTSLVEQICDEAIWLDGGTLKAIGPPSVVVSQYIAAMEERERQPPGRGS